MSEKLSPDAKMADKFLSQGKDIKHLIKQLLDAYENATSVTGSINSMPVQVSKGNSSEKKFIEYSATAEWILKEKQKQDMIYERIVSVINKVENNSYKSYLYARYISGKTREKIAEELGISLCWLDVNVRPKALETVARIIKCTRT